MKRLTRRSEVGEGLPVKHINIRHADTTSEDTLTEILEALAAYEDTDLRPEEMHKARSLAEWGEDYGDCLWWSFPIEEPPYCGTPLDCDFPDHVTHFTRLVIPQN